MNEVYLLGKVLKIGKFRFVYGKNLLHKSMMEMVIETVDNMKIVCRGYDNMADKILREEYSIVLIYGRLKTDGFVEIVSIEKV